MKKITIIACSLLIFASCKNTAEEVKIDETQTEIDTLMVEDTISVTQTESSEDIPMTTTVDGKTTAEAADKKDYASFGAKIAATNALSKEQMLKKYQNLKKGDTIAVKFKSTINTVCKKKGCWMNMELPGEKESFVRFKDYGFFVPLNADASEAIVSGKAFIDVVSIDELKHYAKDGGKSDEEIAQITKPKITYAFQADGVLIEK